MRGILTALTGLAALVALGCQDCPCEEYMQPSSGWDLGKVLNPEEPGYEKYTTEIEPEHPTVEDTLTCTGYALMCDCSYELITSETDYLPDFQFIWNEYNTKGTENSIFVIQMFDEDDEVLQGDFTDFIELKKDHTIQCTVTHRDEEEGSYHSYGYSEVVIE